MDYIAREKLLKVYNVNLKNESTIYAPRRLRGLGLVSTRKEIQIQHFAIAKKLSKVDDELFHSIYDCEAEMDSCKEALGVKGETPRELRKAWRTEEYENWCKMNYASMGVKHYAIHPRANRFVSEKCGLSGSEWTAAIKLSFNYANLAGVPGTQMSNRYCRRCGNGEIETIAHVLGKCAFGLNRRIARHHTLKHKLANMLREKGLYTVDEAYCEDQAGSSRFIDILAFQPGTNRAYIIDPTIRFEGNDDMDKTVREEKERIYRPCIPDLGERYKAYGRREFEVLGIWLGARGTVGRSLVELFERFGLDKSKLPELAETALTDSIRIIHHHIYAA